MRTEDFFRPKEVPGKGWTVERVVRNAETKKHLEVRVCQDMAATYTLHQAQVVAENANRTASRSACLSRADYDEIDRQMEKDE
jgi:hypothetical protein